MDQNLVVDLVAGVREHHDGFRGGVREKRSHDVLRGCCFGMVVGMVGQCVSIFIVLIYVALIDLFKVIPYI
jgi:hypothetical protein